MGMNLYESENHVCHQGSVIVKHTFKYLSNLAFSIMLHDKTELG